MAGGVLLPIPEGQRNGAPQLVLFSDPSELLQSLRLLRHEILVVEDDYLLYLIGDSVDGPVVGSLQGMNDSSVGQHAAETRTRVEGEDVWRLVGSQPRLYDLAHRIRIYCLALQGVFRVLLLEPVDLYLRYRS